MGREAGPIPGKLDRGIEKAVRRLQATGQLPGDATPSGKK